MIAYWESVMHFLVGVAQAAVAETAPLLGRAGGKVVSKTAGGDDGTAADHAALGAVERCLRAGPFRVSLLDEEHGVFRDLADNPTMKVIVDEIDGTRSHAIGQPTCSVSLAALDADEEPMLGNVRCGVILTFDGRCLAFVRGEAVWRDGVRWVAPPDDTPFAGARSYFETMNSGNLGLMGLWLGPFEPTVRNGLLSIASTTYSTVKIVEGSAHVHLHLGHRLYQNWPELRPAMDRLYGGPMGQLPHDVAAAAGLLREAGRSLSDGYGRPLWEHRLDSPAPFSSVSASNAELHREVMRRIDEREGWLREREGLIRQLLLG